MQALLGGSQEVQELRDDWGGRKGVKRAKGRNEGDDHGFEL